MFLRARFTRAACVSSSLELLGRARHLIRTTNGSRDTDSSPIYYVYRAACFSRQPVVLIVINVYEIMYYIETRHRERIFAR